VTPIAFDRHPKAKDRSSYHREIAGMIAQGAVRVGLPEPRDVIVTSVSAHLGVPPAHVFPRLQRKDGSQRRHAHAIIVFDRAVRGPIVLGAGRYRGYGACRPLPDGEMEP
jgi:CRISPR-associated protein Csb2